MQVFVLFLGSASHSCGIIQSRIPQRGYVKWFFWSLWYFCESMSQNSHLETVWSLEHISYRRHIVSWLARQPHSCGVLGSILGLQLFSPLIVHKMSLNGCLSTYSMPCDWRVPSPDCRLPLAPKSAMIDSGSPPTLMSARGMDDWWGGGGVARSGVPKALTEEAWEWRGPFWRWKCPLSESISQRWPPLIDLSEECAALALTDVLFLATERVQGDSREGEAGWVCFGR